MRLLPLFLMLTLTASGCGVVESKKIDYKSAGKLRRWKCRRPHRATGDNRYAFRCAGAALPPCRLQPGAQDSTERRANPAADAGEGPHRTSRFPALAGGSGDAAAGVAGDQGFLAGDRFIVNLESPETG